MEEEMKMIRRFLCIPCVNKMGKSRRNRVSRLENHQTSSPVGIAMDKEEEISRLRELNESLVKNFNISPQDQKAYFLEKLVQMESRIHNLEGKCESKLDNLHGGLTEQVKVGKQLIDNLKGVEKEFRKDELPSTIVAARQEEMAKSNKMAEQALNISSLAAYKKKIEEMSIESERALLQSRAEKIEMQSMMDEFNSRAGELLEEKHVWLSEK